MSNPNYSLDIISHHPQFANKALRKYNVEGIETVGAFGSEPFEIRFKNNTWQKIQVKLSLDGTDIMTGEPADTNASGKMWVVNGYDTLTLKAWPENNQGGAAFVFTSADNSVALHTHGDMSNRGIIAAAVFTEGHVQPITWNYQCPIVITQPVYPYWPTYPYYQPYYDKYYWTITNTPSSWQGNAGSIFGSDGITHNSCVNTVGAIMDCNYMSEASAPLESLAAVGAGQFTEQHITNVVGLIKPMFAETVRVRYIWWDALVEKLRTETAAQAQPSGFPGDKKAGINLGSTPRIGDKKTPQRTVQQTFSRV